MPRGRGHRGPSHHHHHHINRSDFGHRSSATSSPFRSSSSSSRSTFSSSHYNYSSGVPIEDIECPDFGALFREHCTVGRLVRAAVFLALIAGAIVALVIVSRNVDQGTLCNDIGALGIKQQAVCHPASLPGFPARSMEEAVVYFSHSYDTQAFRFEGRPQLLSEAVHINKNDVDSVLPGKTATESYALVYNSSIEFRVHASGSTAEFFAMTRGNYTLWKSGKPFVAEYEGTTSISGSFRATGILGIEYVLVVRNPSESEIDVTWDIEGDLQRYNTTAAISVFDDKNTIPFTGVTANTWIVAETTSNSFSGVRLSVRLPTGTRSAITAGLVAAPVLLAVVWLLLEFCSHLRRHKRKKDRETATTAEATKATPASSYSPPTVPPLEMAPPTAPPLEMAAEEVPPKQKGEESTPLPSMPPPPYQVSEAPPPYLM